MGRVKRFRCLLALALCAPGMPTGLTAQAVWEIRSTGDVTIGDLDGPPETRFDRVRSVHVVADGKILVADRGSNEVRVFQSDGRHGFSTGREGEGPGEFIALEHATPYRGDSLAAFDFRTQRITIFDRDGELGRTHPFGMPPGIDARAVPWGSTEDGGWVVAWNAAAGQPGVVSRSSLSMWRHDAIGAPGSPGGAYPGRESARSVDGAMALDLVLPWGLQTIGAWRGTIGAVGDNGAGTVSVWADDVTRVVTLPWAPEEFSESVLDGYIDQQASRVPAAMRDRIDAMFRMVATPDVLPRFDRIFIAGDEAIWIRRLLTPGRDREEWAVYSSGGVHLAVVEGVLLGDFDVEYVQVRSLVRG